MIAASAEVGPHGQQTSSEDKSVTDRLERMQRQRRALGEAIQHSASSRFPLNERSEETAAFFVAASINSMRRSASEDFAIFDTDFVKQVSCSATALGGHELLMDRANAESPLLSSSGGSCHRSSAATSAASPDGRRESAGSAGSAMPHLGRCKRAYELS